MRRVPGFNYNIEQSRQSMDKLDSLVKAEHAQLWINHDAKQNATIVHAPQVHRLGRRDPSDRTLRPGPSR